MAENLFNVAIEADLEMTAKLLGVPPGELVGGLNLVQAAQLLGIAPSTLRLRGLAGKIGCQRDGRAWRFFWWHISAYLARRERPMEDMSIATGEPVRPERSKGLTHEAFAEAKEIGLL